MRLRLEEVSFRSISELLCLITRETAALDMFHGLLVQFRVLLKLFVQELELLARLLKAFSEVLLRDSHDVVVHVECVARVVHVVCHWLKVYLVQLTAEMLDARLQIKQHLLDLIIRFLCLVVFLSSERQGPLHVIDLLARHCLEALKLHPFQVVLDVLLLFRERQKLALALLFEVCQVLMSLRLVSELLDDVVRVLHTGSVLDLLDGFAVLFVSLLAHCAGIFEHVLAGDELVDRAARLVSRVARLLVRVTAVADDFIIGIQVSHELTLLPLNTRLHRKLLLLQLFSAVVPHLGELILVRLQILRGKVLGVLSIVTEEQQLLQVALLGLDSLLE